MSEKWKVLTKTDGDMQEGDIFTRRENGPRIPFKSGFGLTLAGLYEMGIYETIERRVKDEKPKRLKLRDLHTRLNKHQLIEIYHDGSVAICSFDAVLHAADYKYFKSIADLQAYFSESQ